MRLRFLNSYNRVGVSIDVSLKAGLQIGAEQEQHGQTLSPFTVAADRDLGIRRRQQVNVGIPKRLVDIGWRRIDGYGICLTNRDKIRNALHFFSDIPETGMRIHNLLVDLIKLLLQSTLGCFVNVPVFKERCPIGRLTVKLISRGTQSSLEKEWS